VHAMWSAESIYYYLLRRFQTIIHSHFGTLHQAGIRPPGGRGHYLLMLLLLLIYLPRLVCLGDRTLWTIVEFRPRGSIAEGQSALKAANPTTNQT